MKTEQRIYSDTHGWIQQSDNSLGNTTCLVFVFGAREFLKNQNLIRDVRGYYPNASIIGCSTSGEICQESIHTNHLVSTAVLFEKTTFEIAREPVSAMDDSYAVGHRLAEKLDRNGLVHVLVFSEGLNINGSELVRGLNNHLDQRIAVTGGLAGDQVEFAETVVVHNNPGERNVVLAIGLYGTNLKVGYGSQGGWDSFGVDREVTRSDGNILFELDGQPALELYKRYLGNHAAGLPASALLFPLSLRTVNSDVALVRTILSVNEQDGSMVFAGNVPQGEYVRLMKANSDRLVDGALGAAEMAMESLGNSNPQLALLISCVGRKLVLKQKVEEEVEVIRERIGPQATMTGFYSYGEICPVGPFQTRCELHNQTMTITLFHET